MPALFVFLFKVNIALLLFCAGYYLVLRRLTFYSLNRVYLMAAIVFATIYPEINLSSFVQNHEAIARPVQTVVLYWEAPAKTLIKPLVQPNYWQWAVVLFWAGVAILGIRLLMQLFSLFLLHKRSKPAVVQQHDVRLIKGEAAPFSFWRSIYVNPANHSDGDLRAILQHEQVHVNGWHTVDILLAELSSIVYWFNPGIWLMKKAVRENIEFITDRKILNQGFDSKTYQYSLVNVSFNNATPGIVNHFNLSTIKKRIIMMNAKRSSKATLTRYAFVVPAVVALLLVFTFSKASVTKPIANKITNALKPVTAKLTEAIKPVSNKLKQAALTILPADTVPAKADGKKRIMYHIVTDVDNDVDSARRANNQHTVVDYQNNHFHVTGGDSANFVVNGKKMKPSEFKELNPGDIMAINIVDAASAKKLFTAADKLTFDNDRSIIFVTTRDSEAGKKLMEKLGNNRQLKDLRVIKDGVPQAITGDLIVSSGDTRVFTTSPDNRLQKFVVTGSANSRLQDIDSLTTTVSGFDNHLGVASGVGVSSVNYIKRLNGKIYRIDNNSGVNRMSDKLFVIDGKPASEKEMKKISAFDIDRIDFQSNSDTIKKYGDKAKYGVVFIYTKKGK